jgi:cellulose synthase/poly-beta-1,6-N-acetylglucosamine synthase-like glycosyltransferase
MKSKLSTWLQVAVWCVACLLTLIPLFSGKPAEQFTGNVIATLFWMAVFYLFFFFMAPSLLLKKKFVAFFGISMVVLLILPFFGYSLLFLSRALFNGSFIDFYQGYSPGMHMSGFKALALAGVYGSFFRLIIEHFGE